MNKKIVAANWKMNVDKLGCEILVAELKQQLATLDTNAVQVVICPSFIWLERLIKGFVGTDVAVGSQNICQFESGAYTGEVSAHMVSSLGVRYAIVGHSERRSLYHDTDEVVALKCQQASKHNLIPILCVGETIDQRNNGCSREVVAKQLDAVIAMDKSLFAKLVVAYEPVWAIGTGLSASMDQVEQMHSFIHGYLLENTGHTPQIQYGGSVKPANAKELAGVPFVDGFLVGGASLNAREFQAIVSAVG